MRCSEDSTSRGAHVLVAALSIVLVGAACTDNTATPNQAVVRSVEFAGYLDPAAKLTTCGTCHKEHQHGWVRTAHSWTWTGPAAFQLQDNPNGIGNQDSAGATTDCAWCHTMNGHNSGRAPDSTGWWGVSDSAKKYYTDVQCEACHGPGAAHAAAPDQGAPVPTGSIVSDTGLTTGCSVCHNEPDNPYGAEWRSGAHGTVLTSPAGQPACAGCHEGKAVVQRFDPQASFAEQGSSTLFPITCVACHDPHGMSNAWAAEPPAYDRVWLRAPIDVADVSVNLCMQCHNRRATPDLTTSRGAHAPQGPILLGTAGWQPPGFAGPIVGTHGSSANPKLCVGCHMPSWGFTSPTGKPWNTPGHRFWAIPCMQADGTTPDTTNGCTLANRNFGACTTGGCHGSASLVQQAFQSLDQRLQTDLDLLWHDTNGNGVIDAGDTGLLTQVPSTEFAVNSTMTVAKGALFNVTMMAADRSHGVHNPIYLEELLIATTQAVATQYGLPLPTGVAAQLRARARALHTGLPN